MKYIIPIVAVAMFGGAAALITTEGAFVLVIGWFPFLRRVGPQMTVDRPTVLVGAVALLLLTCGIHALGRRWRIDGHPWRFRWTLAAVGTLFLLFASGVAAVGIVHQVGWLATSDEPFLAEALDGRRGDTGRHLRYLGITAASFAHGEGHLPAGGTFTADGVGLHSWETAILPLMSYDTRAIDLNTPWNSPRNAEYFRGPIPEFTNPGYRTPPLFDADGFGLSHYAANVRIMGPNSKTQVSSITDGGANTIAFGEVNTGFKAWGHPVNWRDPANGLGRSARQFGGPPWTGGAQFVMVDGSVRFVSNRVDPAVLKALATPAGGDGHVLRERP